MLCELAITPAVFMMHSDELHPDAHDAHLRQLKDLLLETAIVRDLRGGDWSSFLQSEQAQGWHQRAKELLKKLRRGRLRASKPVMLRPPSTDAEWCKEAIESSRTDAGLTGIITAKSTAESYPSYKSLLATVDNMSGSQWWSHTRSSLRLHRQTNEYLEHLKLVLECSTHLMFIDPNIDPEKAGYNEFLQLIFAAKNSEIIEIHRSQFASSGRDKKPLNVAEWKRNFCEWDKELRHHNRQAHVYLWPDFHDRYLITNLVGISLPHGLDITRDQNKPKTTWSRLPRDVRDDIQLEFDPQKAQGHFTLGA